MAILLRKAWESLLLTRPPDPPPRPPSITNSSSSSSSSFGPFFDQIPADLLVQIIKLLEPKDAAKLTALCSAWRSTVSDNRIWIYFLQNNPNELDPWDSIFFTELNLRSGYPLLRISCISEIKIQIEEEEEEICFMQIYGQRQKVPGSIIIDGGSGYCKFGWSKYDRPSGHLATFMEFGNIEAPSYSRLRNFFATIYGRMRVKPSNQPIVLSIPLCHYDDTESAKASRRQLKEAIHSALFDMNVPAVCAINQAALALYAASRTSGIVINIGFEVTSIVPILHGKVMRKVGVIVIGMGAMKLTGFLKGLMQQNNIKFGSLYTVRTLKEKLCYVAADYNAELSKETRASFDIPVEGWFTLSKERFQTGEILFQPHMAGVHEMGLHHAVALCMERCHAAELIADNSWFKTLVLSGGTACLPGLSERLEKELHKLLSPSLSNGVRVIPPPFGVDTPWFGAKFLSNLSTFPSSWCTTKKQFRHKSKLNFMW